MSQPPNKPAEPATALDYAAPGAAKGKRNVWAPTVSHVVMIETFLAHAIFAGWMAAIPLVWIFPSVHPRMGCGCELPGFVTAIAPIGLGALLIWDALVRMVRRGPWKWRGGWPLLLAGIAHGVFCACGIVFLVVMPLSDYYDMTAARIVGVVLIFVVPVAAPFRLRVRVSS